MDNPEKLATLCIQDALKYIFVHAETCFEVFMYMQGNENHPTADMVRFTLILWVMLIIEESLVTPKCRTAMNAFFFNFDLCPKAVLYSL